jgi:uncharacterized protein YndB with AHSA1/START domain
VTVDRAHFDPGPLAQVATFEEPDGGVTVVFTRDLPHPQMSVWEALTDPAELEQWAPYTADRNLDGVGPATLTMLGGVDFGGPLPGEVVRADAPEVLEYTWGDDLLRWQLDPVPAGTRLTLRHTVKGPDWVAKVAAGWHLCLVVMDQLLAGEPIGPIVGQEAMDFGWQDLHDRYAVEVGIDA